MKLAGQQKTGTVITETILKRTGHQKGIVEDVSHTDVVGPFTDDPVHAMVGATVATTLARNYHSAHISVMIQIPVPATADGLKTGLDYCFEKANKVLQKHLKGANEALDILVVSRQ